MPGFPLKTAWLTGPALIRRAPAAFAVWVLLQMAGEYASTAVMFAIRNGRGGLGPGPVWAVVVALPFHALLMTAVLRGCLGLGRPSRAFLGAGATEAKMAGLTLLAGVVGMMVALPASMAAAYVSYFLHIKLLAGWVLGVGAAVAALALMRVAPLPAILVEAGRVDIAAALGASRGRYAPLAASILVVATLDRLAQGALRTLVHPPYVASWAALASPLRLVAVAWDSMMGVLALTVMAGVIAVAWRSRRQTLD